MLNRMFRQQLHPSIWKSKRGFNIAIDLTLIPYHGQSYEDKKEIVRGMPKSGTTHFHGYTAVSIVRDDRCYGVALHFIEYGEGMADIVRWLIKRLKTLKIRIRRVFLDKGLSVYFWLGWLLSCSTFTFLCAKIYPPRLSVLYSCQSVFGCLCAAWRSCSVGQSRDCGERLRSFNINLVFCFREVLKIGIAAFFVVPVLADYLGPDRDVKTYPRTATVMQTSTQILTATPSRISKPSKTPTPTRTPTSTKTTRLTPTNVWPPIRPH